MIDSCEALLYDSNMEHHKVCECKVCLTIALDEAKLELSTIMGTVDEYLSGTLSTDEFRALIYGR